MNIDPDQVAGRISRLMQQLQLTQKQFAERLQVTQPAVSKYMQGRIPPSAVLLRLAQLSGTSMEWLLTGGTAATAVNKIAENQVAYGPAEMLVNKIDRLPPLLRNQLAELVDVILQQLR
jgi:transcriptional regulator with XRE-family HTH domain